MGPYGGRAEKAQALPAAATPQRKVAMLMISGTLLRCLFCRGPKVRGRPLGCGRTDGGELA